MQSSDFDYELPDERIARYPLNPRRKAKLFSISPPNKLDHHTFEDLPELLKNFGCDGLWVNDTKVFQARLYMKKPTGGRLEIFLLEPTDGIAEQGLASKSQTTWRCLIRGGRRWTAQYASLDLEGIHLEVVPAGEELEKEEGGTFALTFKWHGEECYGDVLDALGRMPLPPYMKRESEDTDIHEYQTVFARLPGSVAAPTAGLHYDDVLLEDLKKAGLTLSRLTLHVGAGTFKPLSEGEVEEHVMHAERCVLDKSTLKILRSQSKRVATGTTTLRTLESIYWMAVVHKSTGKYPQILPQWTPYETDDMGMSYEDALDYLLEVLPNEDWTFQTQIMIKPGYRIRSIAGLITNFHQPNSTLLCLVSACLKSGGHSHTWKDIYNVALDEQYRFLSYGDGCLLELE
ncbi:MAG: S-adenosylmethionine tRNA ribosyltransferase [Euryarchaeota archaeon]|nr:S-adenosylmethionine tRNA ribosyltransferase [Euryarchaeota archaeon]